MKIIKKILKKVPGLRALALKTLMFWRFFSASIYSFSRHRRFFGSFYDSRRWAEARLTMAYHSIEKGLAMPNRRLGFGKDAVLNLISLLSEFKRQYSDQNDVFLVSVGVLVAYRDLHAESNFALDETLLSKINEFLSECATVQPLEQPILNKDILYSCVDLPFDKFSSSRRSVRAFSGSVETKRIIDSVSLANNAPSACNRQPCRVHLVESKELIQKCLELQNGNRGFGHLVDKLLIITVDVRSFMYYEPNQPFIDGGLYAMNLSYSLHFNKVAHCMLNWCVPPATDCELRRRLSLRDYEQVIMFIGCGDVDEEFVCAASHKQSSSRNLVFQK